MYFPVAMYPSASVNGEKLYPLVFKVIEALKLHGFPVVSITSDGNSPNHKFYRMCGHSSPPTCKTPNLYNYVPSTQSNVYYMLCIFLVIILLFATFKLTSMHTTYIKLAS